MAKLPRSHRGPPQSAAPGGLWGLMFKDLKGLRLEFGGFEVEGAATAYVRFGI